MARLRSEHGEEPRRSKRPSSAISPVKPAEENPHLGSRTPSKYRPKKKIRFSDPSGDKTTASDSTGLTPWVDKTSLKTPKRRVSTPAPSTRYQDSDYDEVQFTPFREALEPRTIRRIRRHRLSEEMHKIEAEKKSRSDLQHELDRKEQEVQRLKDELQQAQRTNMLLQDDVDSSQGRIDEAEAELDQLRQSFNDDTEVLSWSELPVQHSSMGLALDDACLIQIYEDEDPITSNQNIDGEDALAMGLELESAREAKQALFRSSQNGSTPSSFLQFVDSPVRPSSRPRDIPNTPSTFHQDLAKQLKAATSKAEDAELALQALNQEIQTLGFSVGNDDTSTCISNIKTHFRQMRLDLERIIPGEIVGSFDNAKLIPEIILKLKLAAQTVRDREAELKSMRDQQRSLKGNFDHAILAAEKANARVKDLEDAVDKNAEEMLEIRMRAQSWEREAKEHESNNQSLIAALEKYRGEVTRLEQLVQLVESEQAARLQAVRTATLAEMSQQMSDLEAKAAAETRGRRAAEESAVDRLKKINDLESTLTSARLLSDDLKQQLRALEKQQSTSMAAHSTEIGSLNSRVSNLATSLASANLQIERLQMINSRLEDRYRNEVDQGTYALERIQNEYIRSVAKMNEERKKYLRSSKVRLANWNMESDDLIPDDAMPMTPASLVRFADIDAFSNDGSEHIEGTIELSRGKTKKHHSNPRRHSDVADLVENNADLRSKPKQHSRRRRYDSGIGMDSLSDVGEEEAEQGEEDEEEDVDRSMLSDPISPDLSSEADIETDARLEIMA